MTVAGHIGAGLALGLAMACPAWAEEGARAGASLWAGPPDAAAASGMPAAEVAEKSPGKRIDELAQSVAELEKIVGTPRGFRPRPSFDRRLDDLETRLDKIEKRMNDLENRTKRVETRKP